MGDRDFGKELDGFLEPYKKDKPAEEKKKTIRRFFDFRNKRKAFRKGFEKGKSADTFRHGWIHSGNVKRAYGLDFLPSEEDKYVNLQIGGIAKKYLDSAVKENDRLDFFTAMSLYNYLGKNNKAVKSKVFSAFKKIYSNNSHFDYEDKKIIKSFLEGGSNLEGKVTGAIAIAGFAGGLIFLAPTLTANVVGNLTNSTSGWIGGILFVLGIVGAFFYFRKN